MKTIGITGGVGAGKSLVLDYIKKHYRAKVYLADEIANTLKLPGNLCYRDIVSLLGEEVLCEDKTIDKNKMAEKIFSQKDLLEKVNAIIHPAVKQFVLSEIEQERKKGEIDFFVLEAALLIEDHYDQILDELWYVYANPDVRANRLKESRNYSEEKIAGIMSSQLSEEEFRKHCKVMINNDSDLEYLYFQIDSHLEEE